MKIKLETQELFTGDGIFLKRLSCPKNIKSSHLAKSRDGELSCSTCSETIIDTKDLDEEELLKILEINPLQCVKVNLNQSNLNILRKE